MKGIIYLVNYRRGMVAVHNEDGSFLVFELLGADSLEIGDQVKWEGDTSLGSTILRNVTQGQAFEVYFQNH
jgi:hypothetical protein